MVLFLLNCMLHTMAGINVRVNVVAEVDSSLDGCEICVTDSDSIVFFAIIKEPQLTFTLHNQGTYNISIAKDTLYLCDENYTIECDTTLTINAHIKTINLNEVVVYGETAPKYTTTGQIFKLSEKAKKCGNPFKALAEIPLLNVDISNQSIGTREGDTPLVLIDGKYINTGVEPIDPKFIESVEITEVVNAKYLMLGVSKILNIKLKRNVAYYTYVDARTRNDIPIREGFGGANFEFGTSKFAVSGNFFGNYLHNDKTEKNYSESLAGSIKHQDISALSEAHGFDGALTVKWNPSVSEYFAGTVKRSLQRSKLDLEGTGVYDSMSYNSRQNNKMENGGWLAALFYEHTFKDKSTLSTFAKYNRGISDEEDIQHDMYGDSDIDDSDYWEYEKSRRNQYTLTVDYDGYEHCYGTISGGNNFEYTKDGNYDLTINPFDYASVRLISNYSYFSYSYNWKNVFIMASAGTQYMKIKTTDGNNSWWKPRATVTFGLNLPWKQFLRCFYYLDNDLPKSSQLHTFNHSTNPWLRIEGNPFLVPIEKHTLRLNYDKRFSKINARIYGELNINRNMIEAYIREGEGIAVKSYRNYGHYKDYNFGYMATYRTNNFMVSFNALHKWEEYNSLGFKNSISLGGNLKWDFGNFFVYSLLSWRNRMFTPTSTTKYLNPTEAHIQIGWQITKCVYASLGLPYFCGIKKEKTTIKDGNYYNSIESKYRSMSLRPWLLISWTIRKNSKHAIDNKMPSF